MIGINFICISLKTGNVGLLVIYSFTICVSLLENDYFDPLPAELFVLLLLNPKHSLHILCPCYLVNILLSYKYVICKYFLHPEDSFNFFHFIIYYYEVRCPRKPEEGTRTPRTRVPVSSGYMGAGNGARVLHKSSKQSTKPSLQSLLTDSVELTLSAKSVVLFEGLGNEVAQSLFRKET